MEHLRGPQPTALVVDDEPQMVYMVAFALETQGFRCLTAGSAEDAWQLLQTTAVDLIILDVMLPGDSGLDLCRRVRAGQPTPIILLTALGNEDQRVNGLEAGADDYVTKPFSPRELALRASAVVRRSTGRTSEVVTNGPLRIVPAVGEVTWEGRQIRLPATESRLLAVLARQAGAVTEWQSLLNEVWETTDRSGGKEMVRTTVYRLRQHLKNAGVLPELVVAVRGRGYSMPLL